ncbi:MAG: hypothetical protein A2087_13990 [Spirochaetes bacterium GWD1_61_31]|nr:MAG: hypothetical protein A2Y37_09375 [Spirochaetes bacterium GWB1_60_80]OHD29183.1 MAG: hypothetical protein A2004_05725 [Spirochaetes bacterium GWC1_61_12]OHD42237.1 MAG: hypothetical protein A2087_13990 [Spirochaetes bacterium GWD1_61_31]OHD44026.1 MAG: hypothetical protein A2Y35_01675 [Spirochaetes bacterium GWE1_60_18]OHD59061.1 MAG: hypothetical protein A2Y32_02395 [Spirochaetes bacterium GWF1_60_12]HAP44020.1 hypothetical protein [Spirochaetaceae bacterium]
MLDELELDSEDKVKAFTHPYRMKLLHVLKELHKPATATEVARALGDGPGKVHYHMRILESAGIVVLSHTETVNGIIARYYQPAAARFRVQAASLGSASDQSLRDEVARLITQRFKDGLKVFLERTTGPTVQATKDPGSFLYDLSLYCNDEQWLELRRTIDQLAARYREPAVGSCLRHLFAAGATEYSAADAAIARAAIEVASDGRPVGPLPAPDVRWTFGISFQDGVSRFRTSLPPL